jgi:hypothetical protein
VRTGADIEGEYRYLLWRVWDDGPRVLFVMLNPSTADETKDDPTIRRCIGFARLWGFAGLEVANIFALRSRDPRLLYTHPEPVGPRNNVVIHRRAKAANRIILAWGNHGRLKQRGDLVMREMFKHRDVQAFRMTKHGQPEHPLYQPANPEMLRLGQDY